MQCLQCFSIPRCTLYGNKLFCYYVRQCIPIPCATQPGPPIPRPGPVEISSTSPTIMSYHDHPPGSDFCAEFCKLHQNIDIGTCMQNCMNALSVTSPTTPMLSGLSCFDRCMQITGGNFYTCQNICRPHYQ